MAISIDKESYLEMLYLSQKGRAIQRDMQRQLDSVGDSKGGETLRFCIKDIECECADMETKLRCFEETHPDLAKQWQSLV